MNKNMSCSCNGGGCVGGIVFVLVMYALFAGLPTPSGILELDIFPPAIRLTN